MARRYSLPPKLIVLLALGFALRLVLSPFGTLELDFNTFFSWSQQLVSGGFASFYNSWSDYLPGYLYVLWLLGKVSSVLPQILQVLLYKFPAILADIGVGVLIFYTVRSFREKWALPAAAFYLFNPAVIANSTLWGQIEGVTAFFALASVFFSRTNLWLSVFSALALGAGALIKPQAAFITPLVLFLWIKRYGLTKSFVLSNLTLLIFVLGFVPFSGDRHLLPFIFERLLTTVNQYPYTSVNAFNFWAIVPGVWKPDAGLWQMLGVGVVVVTLGIITFRKMTHISIYESPKIFLLTTIYFLLTFLFLTRMHERHLLPTLAPLVIAAAEFPLLFIPYMVLSLTYIANLHYSFVWISQDFRQIFGQEVIILISAINLLCAGLIMTVFLRHKNFQFEIFNFHSISKFLNFKNWKNTIETRELIPNKLIKSLLAGIIVFAFASRLIGLWHPNAFYFDEVYHAWTAREMLRGNPAAWEWWNTPPEGFAYEWSHPPLAKLFMWGSTVFLGDNSFAWRLPGALLGTSTVLLIYFLGFQLISARGRSASGGKTVALFSAAVFALDGLPLVMSRIGMNDTYFLFFALLSVLLFLKEKYFFSSVLLGLALASKWTAIWVVPVLFIAMVLFKQKPRLHIFWIFIIPPLVYFASYIPFFISGHTINQFIELQQQMWWYHTGLVATHSYGSPALTWPFMLRPVWFFVEYRDNFIANIYAMGNPLVMWLGVVSVGVAGVVGVVRRNATLLFIVLSWALMFLPWAFSPRIMFYYHYLPAVPFLSLAFGWFLSQQKKRIIIACYLLLVTCYLILFPHWAGIIIPKWWDEIYYLIPNWR